MSKRIVPDNSVLIAAFYPEVLRSKDGGETRLSDKAAPILTAINESFIQGYAPNGLISEFLKVSHDKFAGRRGASISRGDADEAVSDFLLLPIDYVSEAQLAQRSWELTCEHGMSPTDAWFLACAEHVEADLWISHRQRDGFADVAQSLYPNVFLLTEDVFRP